jgi:D-proline reductase (dithiol) PrdB
MPLALLPGREKTGILGLVRQASEDAMGEPTAGHVRYIDKTRAYYAALGYDKPYRWAENGTAPFAPLAKPLAASTVVLISTSEIAIKDDPRFDDKDPAVRAAGNVYVVPADTPAGNLYSRTNSYDRYATSLDDPNAYFPIERLHEAARAGRIGRLAPDCIGVFNAYSHRKTMEVDAPEVLRRCRAMQVDAAILVPV